MIAQKFLIILSAMFLVSACTTRAASGGTSKGSQNSSENASSPKTSGGTNSSAGGKTKVVVPAHTLSDTNPPVDVDSDGIEVTKTTWNSFLSGSATKFYGHYNFTYTVYYNSTGDYEIQYFTKNGYAINSYINKTFYSQYYERKSGNTFYQYISVNDGWLRQETTLDLTAKFTDIFMQQKTSNHMTAFDDYKYNGGFFIKDGGTYSSTIMFQYGSGAYYLTFLSYSIPGTVFYKIDNSFQTEIEIPKSYYYQ